LLQKNKTFEGKKMESKTELKLLDEEKGINAFLQRS
jgi:hypothetical protein